VAAVGVDDCELIEFPVVGAPEGNLTFIEGGNHLPFDIARTYYLYNVPVGAVRGGHAHRTLRQVLIPIAGGFKVLLDDGTKKRSLRLDQPYIGLLMTPMIWRELVDFSAGSVCLVLASAAYEESDYFRRYEDFLAAARAS
jgi:WxcM-like, C-terminal